MLTIHAIVKDEPLLYYSIFSVYPYAEEILLYDTGTTDKNCIKQLNKVLASDTDNKIKFKRVELEFDESVWTVDTAKNMMETNAGKKGVGYYRQQQIDETKTPFFMILDGDEIHYSVTMKTIVHDLLPYWDNEFICGYLPLRWFKSFTRLHDGYAWAGRVFRTDKVRMNGRSPMEMHVEKNTSVVLNKNHPRVFKIQNVIPFAHFEPMIKPWRRLFKDGGVAPKLPEIMEGINTNE